MRDRTPGVDLEALFQVADASIIGNTIVSTDLEIGFVVYSKDMEPKRFSVQLHDNSGPGENTQRLSNVFAQMAEWERSRANGRSAQRATRRR